MSDWLQGLVRRLERDESVVRVVVSALRGSAPCEPGTCMLVGVIDSCGTIGGGHLEWKCLEIARGMLAGPATQEPRVDRFVLGATLGQCCGGAVEIFFERIVATELAFFRDALEQRRHGVPAIIATSWRRGTAVRRVLEIGEAHGLEATRARIRHEDGETLLERIDTDHAPLWLFGAGHVGQAIVRTLAQLPFHVTWIDGRGEIFPADLPDNTTAITCDGVDAVGHAPANALYLVLTHSHDLDFELCRAILSRDDVRWAGVIGSATKAASFRKRLARRSVPPERIARLVSPIGVDGIASKLPAAIAVAVAAQLLQVESRAAGQSLPRANAQ